MNPLPYRETSLGPAYPPDDEPEPFFGHCYPCLDQYYRGYPHSRKEDVNDGIYSCPACRDQDDDEHLCETHSHVCKNCRCVAYCAEHRDALKDGLCPDCVLEQPDLSGIWARIGVIK